MRLVCLGHSWGQCIWGKDGASASGTKVLVHLGERQGLWCIWVKDSSSAYGTKAVLVQCDKDRACA